MGRRAEKTRRIRELQACLKASPSEAKRIISDRDGQIERLEEGITVLNGRAVEERKKREAAENVISGMKLELEKANSELRERGQEIERLKSEIDALLQSEETDAA